LPKLLPLADSDTYDKLCCWRFCWREDAIAANRANGCMVVKP
jgi:hypothetical protein